MSMQPHALLKILKIKYILTFSPNKLYLKTPEKTLKGIVAIFPNFKAVMKFIFDKMSQVQYFHVVVLTWTSEQRSVN